MTDLQHLLNTLPIEEVAESLLTNAGFDEDDAGAALDALTPLFDSLARPVSASGR